MGPLAPVHTYAVDMQLSSVHIYSHVEWPHTARSTHVLCICSYIYTVTCVLLAVRGHLRQCTHVTYPLYMQLHIQRTTCALYMQLRPRVTSAVAEYPLQMQLSTVAGATSYQQHQWTMLTLLFYYSTIYLSSYYYVSSYSYMCPHTTVYTAVCVLIPLYLCPHTAIYVSSYYV